MAQDNFAEGMKAAALYGIFIGCHGHSSAPKGCKRSIRPA